jgi:glycosyltransferase involved in cell wall biosynthesis
MFSSTIIPTVNRATLTRAVQSVLEQVPARDDFEVIVVNDSGRPLPKAEWQNSPRVRILSTNRQERSVARNTGAAVAEGRYLHFLDDDDWILPGALESFRRLAQDRAAVWLYGGYQLVDSAGKPVEERRPDEGGNCFVRFMTGEWLPLQASLIDAEAFSAVGGFALLPSLLGGDEDVHLSRLITLTGDVSGTPSLVASIRFGQDQSTTNYADLHRQSRLSREQVLRNRGAFARLRASAIARPADSSYWHGRVSRIYFASAVWNLRRLKLLAAAGRGCLSLVALAAAGRHLVSFGFWRGAVHPHHRESGILHYQSENAKPFAEAPPRPVER